MQEVVIYTRFSPRPNAEECDSCDKQFDRCWEFLKSEYSIPPAGEGKYRTFIDKGGAFSVIEHCKDENVSGGVFDRPGLTRALERLGFGDRKRMLLVDSVDRLARDTHVAYLIKHEVEKAGGFIAYASGISPTDTPEGRFIDCIMTGVAAFERDRIRARTKAGLARKRAQGVYLGKVPIGYKRDPETKGLVEDKWEAECIEVAKTLRMLEGLASREIALRLTMDYGRLRGKPWSERTVRKLLKPGRDQKILAKIQAAKENNAE
jgi:DNA invertase Pin-like site-specific DNA recombinase